MMGNKKLSTIRKELAEALSSTGEDPIVWLEKRITAGRRQGAGTEVLESLKRILEAGGRTKRRRRARSRP